MTLRALVVGLIVMALYASLYGWLITIAVHPFYELSWWRMSLAWVVVRTAFRSSGGP